jgi:putative ABC transport system permease protein
MDLFRRILGSFHDAAWLRRQFTLDADLVHDIRHGARVLRRSPAFATLAVLVLGLGIGATVGIFSVVDTLLVRALPYRDAENVVMIWHGSTTNPDLREDVAPANYIDWQSELRSFDAIAAVVPWSFDYTAGGEPEVLHALAVSNGFFRALGAEPALGRAFTADEFLQGRNRVIVITHGVWQAVFGGRADLVGRTVQLDGEAYMVIGIMPEWFRPRLLQANSERGIFFPKVFQEFERRVRGGGYWNVVARLKAGTTIEQAQRELDVMSARLAKQYPRTNATLVARAQPLREHLAGNLRAALRLLLAAVGLLLLIAAANVANLLLARAAVRTRELAVRSAIGAGRGRLVRQLLAESLLLATLGSLAGLVVAWWTVKAIVRLSPAGIPSLTTVAIDSRVIAFAIVLTGTVAVVVGVIPAWRSSGGRLAEVLRGVSSRSGNRHPLRAGIVVSEVALALLLTIGAGLLVRSFVSLLRTDPGFNPSRVVALQVFAWDRNTTPEKRAAFFEHVLDRMRGLSLVREVGAVSAMPFIEANINMETALFLADRPLPPGDEPSAFLTIATPGYFETMDVELRQGRAFDRHDTTRSTRVAIVSESLARKAWPDGRVLGRRFQFRFEGRMQQAEVVGVVADIRHDALDRPGRAELFIAHAQSPFGSMTFVARVAGEAAPAIAALKAEIHAIDPAQAIYRAATAEELVSLSLVNRRFMLALLGGFAVLAALLAAIGIYGVMSVATTQRTREFGVRIALGADRSEILGMVLRQGAAMTGLGLAIGLVAALATAQVMRGFVYGITTTDPVTLAIGVGALSVVALIACVLPARRATRVDPLVALRIE